MGKSKSSRSSKRKSKGKSSKGESQCTLFKAFAYSGVLLALIAVPLLYPVQTEVALFKVAHKVLVWKLTQWDGLTYAELGCSPEAAAMSTILSLERLPLPDYEKNREAMDKLEHVLHVDPECFFEDTTLIKQDTLAAHIPVRMVLPKHVRKRPVTTVLYLHGGGFVSGSPRSHTALTCEIARLTGSRVVSVDYRLAPENSIADAIDDAVHAYRDLLRQSEPGSFVFMGDSAGGGLAVLALQAIRDDPDVPLPAGAVLLSPWTNLASDPAAYKTREESDVLFAGINALPETGCVAAGLGLGCDYDKLKDPQFSALYGSMDGLPPLYILAGDAEMLADDSIKLADKAKKAGVDVELHLVEKMQHVFPLFADFLPEGREWLERASKWAYERVEGEEA